MINGIKLFTKTKRMKRASYDVVISWVLESQNEITPDCIRNGFQRAKLHTYCDTENSQLNEANSDNDSDNDTDESVGDNEENDQILKQYSDIIDIFNTDFDEDFDGFEKNTFILQIVSNNFTL